jgi:hypothetical protein
LPSYGNAVAGNAEKAFAIVALEFQNPAIFIFYLLGVVATAWHLAYGFFLFAVDWGILIGERAQKMALYACVGLAFFLSAVGINAMVAFNKKCGLLPTVLCEEAEKKGVVEPPNGSRNFRDLKLWQQVSNSGCWRRFSRTGGGDENCRSRARC